MIYLFVFNVFVIGFYNLEICLSVVLLFFVMVMVGLGNLKVLQFCCFLYMKMGGEMNYGFYLVYYMVFGFLFLGGGRYFLSILNFFIVVFFCVFYLYFLVYSIDNWYYFQVFWYFYVLVVEFRFFVFVDVDINMFCYVFLEVIYKGIQWYE